MAKTKSESALERALTAIDAACKEKMEPKPCVGCGTVTSLSLRTSTGHVPYCGECFQVELDQDRRAEKEPPKQQRDPERLPGEDDAAYWSRFERWNRECIERLERSSGHVDAKSENQKGIK
jgi:hypothetical protein